MNQNQTTATVLPDAFNEDYRKLAKLVKPYGTYFWRTACGVNIRISALTQKRLMAGHRAYNAVLTDPAGFH
jgi:hypothetical protein